MRELVAIALVGCVSRVDITHVVLRDVSKIAIAADGTTIMPIDASSGEVPGFAYVAAPLHGSGVAGSLPEPPGAIIARCPSCAGIQRVSALRETYAHDKHEAIAP